MKSAITKEPLEPIATQQQFDESVVLFRKSFLSGANYDNRIELHRNPIEVMHETLRTAHNRMKEIWQHEELHDVHDGQVIYTIAAIADLWKSDRRLKTLFAAVKHYCTLREKPLPVLAAYIAQYRGIEKAAAKIRVDVKLFQSEVKIPKPQQPHFGNINIIRGDRFVQEMMDYHAGKKHLAQVSAEDFFLSAYDTEPIQGFVPPKGYPSCCPNHRNMLLKAERYLQEFPDCCDNHGKLITAPWFQKSHYDYLPKKYVDAVTFTWHCIQCCIKHKNWFKEIVDYIDYTKTSFGSLPTGYGAPVGINLYLSTIRENLASTQEFPNKKRQAIIDFIDDYYKEPESREQTDVNLLIEKYKEWLKLFPFNLPFFQELKPYFEGQLPLLKGQGQTNLYTGLTGFQLKTKKELLGFLLQTTALIIKEINSLTYHEDGKLDDPKDLQRQFILEQRKIELSELELTAVVDRRAYIKVLKRWLSGEKKFLKELGPFLPKEGSQTGLIKNILAGFRELQSMDADAEPVRRVQQNESNKEAAFQFWFKTFFAGRYHNAVITAEEKKGNGRIDLVIRFTSGERKVIELKGWWNNDRKSIIEQVCSYLTDFETDGYCILINHKQNQTIDDDYRSIITDSATGYVPDSWKLSQVERASVVYYTSLHKVGQHEKTIFHFIFNVPHSRRRKAP